MSHHDDYRPLRLAQPIPGKQCGRVARRRKPWSGKDPRVVQCDPPSARVPRYRGCPDPRVVQCDPPSARVPRYRGCPRDCDCLKCRTERRVREFPA